MEHSKYFSYQSRIVYASQALWCVLLCSWLRAAPPNPVTQVGGLPVPVAARVRRLGS